MTGVFGALVGVLDEIGGGANMNDIWGWTAPAGEEFALVVGSDQKLYAIGGLSTNK